MGFESRIPHGVRCSCDDCMDEDALKRALGDYSIAQFIGTEPDNGLVKR